MKQILLMIGLVALVGCGKDSRPAENADKRVGNKKEGGENPSSEETKKGAANAKLESTGKGGEEYLNRLPEAGTWVLHELAINLEFKDDEGKERRFKFSGTVKIASLDTEFIKGKRCRAIEIETELKMQTDKAGGPEAEQEKIQQLFGNLKNMPPFVLNFTFDEVGLQKQEDPFQSFVAIRVAVGGLVQELPIPLGKGFIAPELKDKAKKLELKEIETKLGKLKCTGDVRNVDINRGLGEKSVISLEVRRHESVPFGMVSTLATLKGKDDKTIATLTLKVKEVGKGAVSKLPKSE
tara:strand:+ start:892 stop:1776 length:885 start_codon:yes stop_codon:yes gene_type:complete